MVCCFLFFCKHDLVATLLVAIYVRYVLHCLWQSTYGMCYTACGNLRTVYATLLVAIYERYVLHCLWQSTYGMCNTACGNLRTVCATLLVAIHVRYAITLNYRLPSVMLFYTSMYLVVYHVSMLFPRGILA